MEIFSLFHSQAGRGETAGLKTGKVEITITSAYLARKYGQFLGQG